MLNIVPLFQRIRKLRLPAVVAELDVAACLHPPRRAGYAHLSRKQPHVRSPGSVQEIGLDKIGRAKAVLAKVALSKIGRDGLHPRLDS